MIALANLGYPDSVVYYNPEKRMLCIDCAALWRINKDDTLFQKYCYKKDVDRFYSMKKKYAKCMTVGRATGRSTPSTPPPQPQPPEGVEWYIRSHDDPPPYRISVVSTQYLPDPPPGYEHIYGDGDVLLVENPTDTPVIVVLFHSRREILEDMNRDLWYGGLNDLFFFVKIDPPLRGDSNEIFIVFYIPNLITWDTASEDLKRLIMKTIVPITFMHPQKCIDTSYCAIHIPEKDKGIIWDGVIRPAASMDFVLPPRTKARLYLSPIYAR